MIGQESKFLSIKKVEIPVNTSPFKSACWIGAAPRYFGNKDPWRLIAPFFDNDKKLYGNIRKATTINKSAFKMLILSCKTSLFKDSAGKKLSFNSFANWPTGVYDNDLPRPNCLGGLLTTASKSCFELFNAFRIGQAIAELPIKMIFFISL